jgi:hypothetical protein
VPIPAGAMGANGVLRITTLWSYTNSGNNKILRVKLGTQIFHAFIVSTTLNSQLLVMIRNRNSEASQVGQSNTVAGLGTATSTFTSGTIDTSLAKDVAFTALLNDSGETITLESYLVELLYRA